MYAALAVQYGFGITAATAAEAALMRCLIFRFGGAALCAAFYTALTAQSYDLFFIIAIAHLALKFYVACAGLNNDAHAAFVFFCYMTDNFGGGVIAVEYKNFGNIVGPLKSSAGLHSYVDNQLVDANAGGGVGAHINVAVGSVAGYFKSANDVLKIAVFAFCAFILLCVAPF